MAARKPLPGKTSKNKQPDRRGGPRIARKAMREPSRTVGLLARARPIRLLALDVDGVLTDGSIMLDDHAVETKRFNVRDGQGISAWIKLGFEVAIITRRCGMAVQHRCKELGITRIVQGSHDKSAALDQLLADTRLDASRVAYVGDDWPDMPVLRRVGFPVCPGDAVEPVKRLCSLVTKAQGGRGAVREAIEHILSVQGLLERAIALYDRPSA